MAAQSDAQLLRAYAERRSDAAFAELVRRHIDLVHSAARRMVGDAHLAEDVTQATFLALAKNAAPLSERPVLAGWLHRTAQNIAAQTVRTDVRRRVREQEAAVMNELLAASPEADWEQIAPHLDAALGELTESERDAVMLRYFQRQTARDMAQTLGISDEAAQKRVRRAVDRLREFLAKRGVTVGASGLAVVISANAVQAAPVGLALTITSAATLAGTTLATTATITATKAIAMTTLQKTVVAATITVLAGAGIYEAHQASQLREQNQILQQQQAPLLEQLANLTQTLAHATNQIAAQRDENERLNRNAAELLRLRGEVALLRRNSNELAHLGREDKTTNGEESSYQSWLKRVQLLKQKLEQMPAQKNPEHSYLTEEDWLRAAKRKLDTDADFVAAFSELRSSGVGNFLRTAEAALHKFMNTNSGVFPTELSQIKPFFDNLPSEEVLQRYHIVPASSIPQANISGDSGGWLITLKQPDSGSLWTLGKNGMSGSSYDDSDTMIILAPALKALMDETTPINGKKSITMQQLEPYLTTPEQRAAYQKLVQRSNLNAK